MLLLLPWWREKFACRNLALKLPAMTPRNPRNLPPKRKQKRKKEFG
jgi:hypothetical protein